MTSGREERSFLVYVIVEVPVLERRWAVGLAAVRQFKIADPWHILDEPASERQAWLKLL
jgi:hypothetical protein